MGMMNQKKIILIILATVLCTTCINCVVGVWFHMLIIEESYPPPKEIATFNSPDDRFQLVVKETRPQGFMMESPYVYDVIIMDQVNKRYACAPYHFENDSASLPANVWKVRWDDKSVSVNWHARGKIEIGDPQIADLVGDTPETQYYRWRGPDWW